MTLQGYDYPSGIDRLATSDIQNKLKRIITMIEDVVELSNELARQISSRFLLSSLPCRIDSKIQISKERRYLILQCPLKEEIDFLEGFAYHNIISHILMYCELNDNIVDLAYSFYSKDEVILLKQSFSEAQETLKYHWNDHGLVYEADEFFIDIVLENISRFHIQILNAYGTFSKANRILPDSGFYLDANSPSFVSQYAQYWVAEKIGMTDYTKRFCVV